MAKHEIKIHGISPGVELEELGFRMPAKKKKPTKYPFKLMRVGDSFRITIPDSEQNTAERRKAIRAAVQLAARRYGKELGKRFITREVPRGAKIWRSQ